MTTTKPCIFCRICENQEPSEIILQNDEFVVFRDIRPAAKDHLLVVTRQHIKNCKELTADDKSLVERLIQTGTDALNEIGGNVQDVTMGFHWPPFHTVSHLHLHVISPASSMSFLSRMIFKLNSWWFVSPQYVLSNL